MKKNMNRSFYILSVWIFGVALFFFATKSTSTNLFANTTPCEEEKYEYVCCGPQCEVNGVTKNYCFGKGGVFDCCYDNCDSDPGEN
jgi:hypothetical protein